ncbi:MAG: adenine deaminase [Candidatus Pseudobacter hemicellulosilyticus]|uniref:Adenine deaminase n=1 Tax=Candidatus Pseudobacter hemicellulosilyticus TaxID=3121375 RepID=A0AAJ6BHG4_9BACT|nr:MAG: adenine deaminase [Pseudobacter sp.]
MAPNFTLQAQLVDVWQKKIYPASISVREGRIESIRDISATFSDPVALLPYILPGFIDSHVHIESSMLVPSEFARLAVVHGTVATVSDPHEIANVCGMAGVEYMISNGRTVPFKFYFGAPSCVPATPFETAGATLDAQAVAALLQKDEVKYLSELMNFPGVLNDDPEVRQKIAAARQYNKPVDGHAPGLRGADASHYIQGGPAFAGNGVVISTDHECFTAEEALDKLQHGMKIIIREGSAAKNFEALIGLLPAHADSILFCSDDKHPDSLKFGHINELCKRAIEKGFDLFQVLQAACINPVLHYNLEVGLLRVGDPADFILVNDLRSFTVLQTYIDGQLVAHKGETMIPSVEAPLINHFNASPRRLPDFAVPWQGEKEIPVIEALDGQLITNKVMLPPAVADNLIVSDPSRDLLKIVVVNRYADAPVAKAFVRNFGLQSGALASSVAHDSHNIVAVGVDDESICRAVNAIIEQKGGVCCIHEEGDLVLPLPVAGLMSNADGFEIALRYTIIDMAAKTLGTPLSAPFMTLSFMALLVIPHLKLSDKGLFDGDQFAFIG